MSRRDCSSNDVKSLSDSKTNLLGAGEQLDDGKIVVRDELG